MKAKELIRKLEEVDPETDILASNLMGFPAYDYDGQRFCISFDNESQTIALVNERRE